MSIQVKSITTSTAKYVYNLHKEFKTCVITYLPKRKNPRNQKYAQCTLVTLDQARKHYESTQKLASHPAHTCKKVKKLPAAR